MKARGRGKQSPEIFADLVFVWEAFVALSAARVGTESIRFSEIEAYLNLSCIYDLSVRQEVTHLVRILDIEYFKYLVKKEKQNANSRRRD